MRSGPPDLGRKVVAGVAERLDGLRKEDRLGNRHRLGLEALLARLIPESGEVRRDHDASDDLGVGGLERVDLRREVIRKVLVASGSVSVKPSAASPGFSSFFGSPQALPSASLGNSPPTLPLVESCFHMPV